MQHGKIPFDGGLWDPEAVEALKPYASKILPAGYVALSTIADEVDRDLMESCTAYIQRRQSAESYLLLECKRLRIRMSYFLHGRHRAPCIAIGELQRLRIATSEAYNLERLLSEQDTTTADDRRQHWNNHSPGNLLATKNRELRDRIKKWSAKKPAASQKQDSF